MLGWHRTELLKIQAGNQTRQEALQLPSKQGYYLTQQTTRGQNPGRGHCSPWKTVRPLNFLRGSSAGSSDPFS